MSCRVPLSCLPFPLPRDEARTQLSVSARLTGLRALGRARAAPPGSLSCDKHRVCAARVGSVVFFFFPLSLFALFSVEVVMKVPALLRAINAKNYLLFQRKKKKKVNM